MIGVQIAIALFFIVAIFVALTLDKKGGPLMISFVLIIITTLGLSAWVFNINLPKYGMIQQSIGREAGIEVGQRTPLTQRDLRQGAMYRVFYCNEDLDLAFIRDPEGDNYLLEVDCSQSFGWGTDLVPGAVYEWAKNNRFTLVNGS